MTSPFLDDETPLAEKAFEIGPFHVYWSDGVCNILVTNLSGLVRNKSCLGSPLNWRAVRSPLSLPSDQKHWSIAQAVALTGADAARFVVNPDNSSQSWLTLALQQVHTTVIDWFKSFPAPSQANPLSPLRVEIDWPRVVQDKRFGLQNVQVAWAFASLLAEQIPPMISDQIWIDRICQDVASFSANLHAWVGPQADERLLPAQTLLDDLVQPPAPLRSLLDRALLVDHVANMVVDEVALPPLLAICPFPSARPRRI